MTNIKGLLALFIFLIPLIQSCGEKPVDIKLTEKESVNVKAVAATEEGAIAFAVAAMISPKKTFDTYKDLISYIGKKIGKPVVLKQQKSYEECNEMLKKGEVQAAFVCTGPYITGKKEGWIELVALPVVNGEPFYKAYIIANKDSKFNSFLDLKGKSFAFTDPLSNTGRMVPAYMLSRMNYSPESFFSKVIYTKSHDRSIELVADGIIDGASVDSLIYDFYKSKEPNGPVGKTKIIAQSDKYGIPPIVVSKSTPPDITIKIRNVLLSMHNDQEGQVILKGLNIDKFILPDKDIYKTAEEVEAWITKNIQK